MDKNNSAIQLSPNAWLKEMARLNPAKWNFSRSSRTTFAIVFPMLVGYLTDTLMLTMWVSMGAMFPSIGERDAPYGFTIRKILISAPIGASGFLAGYLGLWIDDWWLIVVIMSVVGFICAIASSYSATVSIGCLQFMVMAAVALGNPEIAQFWKSTLLLLGGTAFYLLLVLLEKWLKPHQIRKDAIIQVLQALENLCDVKLTNGNPEAARLAFTIQYQALYTLMLQNRYQALGHNTAIDQTASAVQNLDNIFVALIASNDTQQIQKLKHCLVQIRTALEHNNACNTLEMNDFAFLQDINDLTLALWSNATLSSHSKPLRKPKISLSIALEQLIPGRSTVRSAAALSLCTFIGYSVRWVDHVSHWYWVPMTVAIVMKPELGSIFVRAVQRTVGTAAGVVLGGFILAVLPVGLPFIGVIGIITFVLPWLSQQNYALTAFAITPLVLVLIDFLSPSASGFDFAALRLVDTLMGCAIVLLFGYLLWPRRRSADLNASMDKARRSIAQYLEQVLQNPLHPDNAPLSEARRNAYGNLIDMRSALQKSLAEPPPAGYEAAAWFPLVACAARLCDAITVYSVSASAQPNAAEWQWLLHMPQCIAGLSPLPERPDAALHSHSPEARLIATIRKETHLRESLYERTEPDALHAPSTSADG